MAEVEEYTQYTIFDYLQPDTAAGVENAEPQEEPERLEVGTRIARLILGEIEEATILAAEGSGKYRFYRTDRHICYDAEESRTDIEQMQTEAEAIRQQYETLEVDTEKIDSLFYIEYAPREVDGRILNAFVGIYNNMLLWKSDITFQFLEPKKDLKKAYKEKIEEITTHRGYKTEKRDYTQRQDKPRVKRMYKCLSGIYSEAEYASHNGAVRRVEQCL